MKKGRVSKACRALQQSCILMATMGLSGCFVLQPSDGGGQTDFTPPRQVEPKDVALPAGYHIEAVARGLTFPSAVVVDESNRVYVVESGYSYGPEFTTPRLLRVEADGSLTEIARGQSGPWTGASYHQGKFYVSASGEEGRILELDRRGTIRVLLDGLPGRADHHTNRPVVGPDGRLYFGQGTKTNSGVVGKDNYKFGWLPKHPAWHDVPCRSTILTGHNFTTQNVLEPGTEETVKTGAFVPYGTTTQAGQVVEGSVPCNGAIMRLALEGGPPEVVAWGLRNPFSLAFSPQGRLYATENGFDVRGSRPIFGAADHLWEVRAGTWYGWPDFSGGMPVTDPRFKPPGKPQPQFLLAEHPQKPPQPAARFGVHSSSNGLDFSHNPHFGYVGQAFVAQFGDMAKSVGKVLEPVGFRVVRVDPETGVIEPFAVNKEGDGPASYLNSGGLERPVDVRFNADGSALYVVDFGVMTLPEQGPEPHQGTGVLWRISADNTHDEE